MGANESLQSSPTTVEHGTTRFGRWLRARRIRITLWIAGASQALAVVVVILAFILSWLALLLAGIFAAIALLFLFSDRG